MNQQYLQLFATSISHIKLHRTDLFFLLTETNVSANVASRLVIITPRKIDIDSRGKQVNDINVMLSIWRAIENHFCLNDRPYLRQSVAPSAPHCGYMKTISASPYRIYTRFR